MSVANAVKACLLMVLFLWAGCVGERDMPRNTGSEDTVTTNPVDLLVGVWLKPIEETGDFDGFQFDADGRVYFLNMFTILGDKWQRVGDSGLDISSHTERYPEPQTDHMVIRVLTRGRLVLASGGNPEVEGIVYHRAPVARPADRMLGRWNTSEDRFFDVTPAGEDFRIVEKNEEKLNVMAGRATAEGMIVETTDRTVSVVLIDGHETGREDWQDKVDCVSIEGVFYLCR